MFLLLILLSYLLGCASTIALLLYLYTRYALYSPAPIDEQQEEQYPTFHPLAENERAKNSAVDAINYLFQFLFQELKDSSRLRRYIMHKLNTEFKELKTSRTGKIFLQNIVIQSFSIGNECPIFSDIRLERQERDERQMIKEFVAKLDVDYKDGFSMTLDVTLLFGQKCQLYIKVKRIYGNLRLEFRREPFCHWLLVFQDEPFIDFDVKSYFATVERPQLAQIVTQQLRRAIKRKQTWPSYKIRYQPFFATSKPTVPTDVLTANGTNLIPGIFDILIKYCDRLSIPLAIYDKKKSSSLTVFLTINVNEQTCADYLHIHREQWPTKEMELVRNVNRIVIKEVNYMDRTELLIEQLEPISSAMEDASALKAALEDKNIFLMKIQGQEVRTLKQANRLLKQKTSVVVNETTASTTTATTTTTTTTTTTAPATTTMNGIDDKIQITIGLPLLHSVRVQRAVESPIVVEAEKPSGHSPALSIRSDASSATPSTVRHRPNASTVKFEKSADTVAVPNQQADVEDEQLQNTSVTTDTVVKSTDPSPPKKIKQIKISANDITLIAMNAELLPQFKAVPTPAQKAETYIDVNYRCDFTVGPNERYLNVCLWCKVPLECDVPDPGKKLILLGYATTALSEIVLDAHMSYKRETQVTLNFQSPYFSKPNLNALTESESKKRLELSTHKGYDDNLAHGFVTINIKHRPEIEMKLNPQDKKEQFIINGPMLNDISMKLKEDERKQEQLKYINTVNEQQELIQRKPTDHIFEDKTFTVATLCACCNKKIWMKYGRQCRDCHVTIHKKCEQKFNSENICTHEPVDIKPSPSDEDSKSMVNIELTNNNNTPIITTTDETESDIGKSVELVPPNSNSTRSTPVVAASSPTTATATTANRIQSRAAAAFSALDSTARRSFRAFGNKNLQPPPSIPSVSNSASNLSTSSELSVSDESLHTPISNSPTTLKKTTATPPIQTSSKLATVASSAYSKLREFKSKRLPAPTEPTNPIRKSRLSSDNTPNENIPENDLRDIISKCLSNEKNDLTGLENLLHERAVDDTALYAKAREFGPELFPGLTPDERKEKFDTEISRLQQEMDLQYQIREEMTQELDKNSTDENEKRKLRVKIANIDEKVQALGALFILYCSGLEHCRTQLRSKETEILTTSSNEFEDSHDDHLIEQS